MVFKIQKWQTGEIVAHKLDPVKSTGCKYSLEISGFMSF